LRLFGLRLADMMSADADGRDSHPEQPVQSHRFSADARCWRAWWGAADCLSSRDFRLTQTPSKILPRTPPRTPRAASSHRPGRIRLHLPHEDRPTGTVRIDLVEIAAGREYRQEVKASLQHLLVAPRCVFTREAVIPRVAKRRDIGIHGRATKPSISPLSASVKLREALRIL